jgi:hypothetical protein
VRDYRETTMAAIESSSNHWLGSRRRYKRTTTAQVDANGEGDEISTLTRSPDLEARGSAEEAEAKISEAARDIPAL